jgi:hypothetical protein
MFPQFDATNKNLPRGTEDIGDGYTLSCKCDRTLVEPSPQESEAIVQFLQKPAPAQFQRWSRLHLPNGQVVRSAQTKTQKSPDSDQRISRHVKVIYIYPIRTFTSQKIDHA